MHRSALRILAAVFLLGCVNVLAAPATVQGCGLEVPEGSTAVRSAAHAASLERIRKRVSSVVLVGANRLIRPHRFEGDERLLGCVAALGYPDADVYRVPTPKLGHDATFIAFSGGDEGRLRARELLHGLATQLEALQTEFVAFRNNANIRETSAQRFDWAWWQTPAGEWIELEGVPREHLARITRDALARSPADATLATAALLAQARIDVSHGRLDAAAGVLHEARGLIGTAPSASAVHPRVQFGVLQELLRDAAGRADEDALGKLITETAELAARLGIETAFTPVRRQGVRYPPGHRRSGNVELQLTVLPDGRVVEPVLLGTDLSEAYVEAAMETVQAWRFMPATRDGKAVAAPWRVNVRYTTR